MALKQLNKYATLTEHKQMQIMQNVQEDAKQNSKQNIPKSLD